jgi:hypothetical protein
MKKPPFKTGGLSANVAEVVRFVCNGPVLRPSGPGKCVPLDKIPKGVIIDVEKGATQRLAVGSRLLVYLR